MASPPYDFDLVRTQVVGRELDILSALGIDPPQRGHIHCPLPNHSDNHPSWRWSFGDTRYFCTCGSGDVYDLIQGIRGGGLANALQYAADVIGLHHTGTGQGIRSNPARQIHTAKPVKEKRRWSSYAQDIWQASGPITGVAAAYLGAVGCRIPPAEGDLRWHPNLENKRENWTGPALVARVTDPITNEPLTLHRTWITETNKAPLVEPRLVLRDHQLKGGVIRLWPDEEVTTGLALAEGIETALSAAHAFTPIWSTVDKDNLSGFPVLQGIEAITIFADPKPGEIAAAEKCANRWLEAGREVRIWKSPVAGYDANDWVRE
jgi:putative DNA primase/helicase